MRTRWLSDYAPKSPAAPASNDGVRRSPTRGAPAFRGDLGLEAELVEPVTDLIAVDAEQLRRLCLIAAGALQGLRQQLPLDVLEIDAFGRQAELRRGDGAGQRREVIRLEPLLVDQQHCPLDGVA